MDYLPLPHILEFIPWIMDTISITQVLTTTTNTNNAIKDCPYKIPILPIHHYFS
jgi:hypothetical protein